MQLAGTSISVLPLRERPCGCPTVYQWRVHVAHVRMSLLAAGAAGGAGVGSGGGSSGGGASVPSFSFSFGAASSAESSAAPVFDFGGSSVTGSSSSSFSFGAGAGASGPSFSFDGAGAATNLNALGGRAVRDLGGSLGRLDAAASAAGSGDSGGPTPGELKAKHAFSAAPSTAPPPPTEDQINSAEARLAAAKPPAGSALMLPWLIDRRALWDEAVRIRVRRPLELERCDGCGLRLPKSDAVFVESFQ